MTIAVNADTKVKVNGEAAAITDIKEGHKAQVLALEGQPAIGVIAMSAEYLAEKKKAKAEKKGQNKKEKKEKKDEAEAETPEEGAENGV